MDSIVCIPVYIYACHCIHSIIINKKSLHEILKEQLKKLEGGEGCGKI